MKEQQSGDNDEEKTQPEEEAIAHGSHMPPATAGHTAAAAAVSLPTRGNGRRGQGRRGQGRRGQGRRCVG